MTLFRRTSILLALVGVMALSLSLTAFATSGEDSGSDDGEETVVTTDIEPAVEVTTPPADAGTADWTYRYLVPTGIVLAVLVVLATTGQYFTNVVRKRYRIVEE
jgi:hypothetical protein